MLILTIAAAKPAFRTFKKTSPMYPVYALNLFQSVLLDDSLVILKFRFDQFKSNLNLGLSNLFRARNRLKLKKLIKREMTIRRNDVEVKMAPDIWMGGWQIVDFNTANDSFTVQICR